MFGNDVTAWTAFALLALGVGVIVALLRRGGPRRCHRCQESNRQFARFCGHCGAPLA